MSQPKFSPWKPMENHQCKAKTDTNVCNYNVCHTKYSKIVLNLLDAKQLEVFYLVESLQKIMNMLKISVKRLSVLLNRRTLFINKGKVYCCECGLPAMHDHWVVFIRQILPE